VTVHTGSSKYTLRQHINVQSDDPDQKTIQLTVTANVLVDLEVVPNILKFENKQEKMQTTIRNYTDVPVQIENIESENEHVSVSVPAMTIPAKGDVVVTAEVLASAPIGFFSSWVNLTTNLKTTPKLRIRVWGEFQK
jgi:hypothetical protein